MVDEIGEEELSDESSIKMVEKNSVEDENSESHEVAAAVHQYMRYEEIPGRFSNERRYYCTLCSHVTILEPNMFKHVLSQHMTIK